MTRLRPKRHYVDESATVDAQGRSRWIRPVSRGYRIACCDCGLVHSMDSRVRDGMIEIRFARDERATGAKRRWMEPAFGRTFLLLAARSLAAVYAEQPAELKGFLTAFRPAVRERRR